MTQKISSIKSKVKKWSWLQYLYIEHYHLNSAYFAITVILTSFLTDALGLPKQWIAILLTVWSLSNRFSRMFVVSFLHHFDTRFLLRVVCTVYSIAVAGLCFSDNPYVIAGCLFVMGISQGTHSLSTYSITSYAVKHFKGGMINYATLAGGSNYGNLVGPLVSNYLFQCYPRSGPFVFAIAVLLSCQAILKMLPRDVPRVEKQQNLFSSIKWILSDKTLRAAYAVIVMSWFLYAPIFSAMPQYFSKILHAPHLTGSFIAFSAFVGMICSVPLTKVAIKLKVSAKTIAQTTFLVYLLGYLSLMFPPNLVSALICVTCLIIGLSLSGPVLNAIIGGRTPNALRSVGFVLNSAAMGIGEAPGYSISSLIIQEQISGTGIGSVIPFHMFMSGIAVICLIATTLMGHLFEEHQEGCAVPENTDAVV